MPEVSVIMGVYNMFDEEILMQAVKSILNQTLSDFEFIIYDDGSHPEAAEILQRVASMDERIRLIGHEKNRGLAFSLNVCIYEARGKYIARMDADDISYPRRLEKQVKFLKTHPEYAWVGTNIHLFQNDKIWGQRCMPEFPTKEDYLRFSPYAHPTVMYRAEIFDTNLGYLASKETLRCEDYEIFMRFRNAGLRGANMQECLLAYREDDSSYKKRSLTTRINEAKCRYRNFKAMGILFPKGIFYVMRPIIACFVPLSLLAWKKHKESSVYWKEVLDVMEENEEETSYGIDGSREYGTIDSLRVG